MHVIYIMRVTELNLLYYVVLLEKKNYISRTVRCSYQFTRNKYIYREKRKRK